MRQLALVAPVEPTGSPRRRRAGVRAVACRVGAAPVAGRSDEARREALAEALAAAIYAELRGKSSATVETPTGDNRPKDGEGTERD